MTYGMVRVLVSFALVGSAGLRAGAAARTGRHCGAPGGPAPLAEANEGEAPPRAARARPAVLPAGTLAQLFPSGPGSGLVRVVVVLPLLVLSPTAAGRTGN
eukprot:CAMPEP_0185185490 /NCGR_PEP_ID=MMETSP1140-20130426/3340_1 /TAXON_ID=298111 /ORGANISM="Pavlova sp., Strain CCMP459" /LENGTH=100 /DNA_ID=CAMNT_0027751685 /DNA_START=176 /DNA_END=478 /DNA_ORIENTATION=+